MIVETHYENRLDEMDNFRMLAYYCYAPHTKKPPTTQKFMTDIWPSPRELKQKEEQLKGKLERARRVFDNIKRNK